MRTKTMHTAALLAIICLGLLVSVVHVDAGARQPSPEDLGYYDDDMYDGQMSSGDWVIGIIFLLGLIWWLFGR